MRARLRAPTGAPRTRFALSGARERQLALALALHDRRCLGLTWSDLRHRARQLGVCLFLPRANCVLRAGLRAPDCFCTDAEPKVSPTSPSREQIIIMDLHDGAEQLRTLASRSSAPALADESELERSAAKTRPAGSTWTRANESLRARRQP